MVAAAGNGPLAPHTRPNLERQRAESIGYVPRTSGYAFRWCQEDLQPSKCSFAVAMMHRHNIGAF